MTEDGETLLDLVYGSIVVDGDYAAILARLSTLFDSHAGAVLERDGDFLQFKAVSNLCPSIMADYNAEYRTKDPWVLAEGDRPAGKATIGSRLVDPAAVEKSGFYADILKPHDIWDILNAKFGEPPGPVVYFTFYHPHRDVFLERHARDFERVGRHIARAHRLRQALRGVADIDRERRLMHLKLTPRETEIACLMLDGHPYAQISARAGVTLSTLHWHVRNIFSKAGVRSRGAFIARFAVANRSGLVD